MWDVSLFVAGGLLVLAGAWDAFVVPRLGLASGKTASWQLYSDSRKWPWLAFGFGVLTCWINTRTGANPVVSLWHFTMGHIFGTMIGAKASGNV